MPLLQTHFERLRAGAHNAGSVARILAESVCEADGAVAVGIFLRDYAGEALYLAGGAPAEMMPLAEPPTLAAEHWEDPLCYCLHTGVPAHFTLTDEYPESIRLLPAFPGVRTFKIYPIPEPCSGMLGGMLALYRESPRQGQTFCRYLCLYAGALLSLVKGKKQSGYALQSLEAELRQIRENKNEEQAPTLVGDSPETQAMRQSVANAARSDAPLLITGETGTGKSLLARIVHKSGRRCSGPFMEINCGALPANLLESELFGHVRGAFSGAVSNQKGLLRSADGGTVLLDEIGEMPIRLQVVLLHALQEQKVRPVGGSQYYPVNVRIIAATNCDLDNAMKEGRFRRDLYHRLAVLRIHMQPLRERRADIPKLCALFLERCLRKQGRTDLRFTPEANLILMGHPYPGNVRELQALVEQAVNNAPQGCTEIDPECLASGVAGDYACMSLADFRAMQERQEEWFIQQALSLYKGDLHACAKALGVHPRTIRRRFGNHSPYAERSQAV